MSKRLHKQGIILNTSLQSYFFERLREINSKNQNPLPDEVVFYTSLIMDKYSLSNELFEKNQFGKFQEKILGIKLLEVGAKNEKQRKSELKDIGDTSLFVTGYFSESFNRKIIDISYYQQIGTTAYNSLNLIVPNHYHIEAFFRKIAEMFSQIMQLIAILSEQIKQSGMDFSILFVGEPKKAS